MKLICYLILAWLILFEFQSEQVREATISGIVTDLADGTPLFGANARISGTSDGAVTDSDGRFQFRTSLTGDQILEISYIGYKTKEIEISLAPRAALDHTIELEREAVEMDDIVITIDNREWQANFDDFRRAFIGTGTFARNTEIKNRHVIDFERQRDARLVATAREPVIVENRALGFIIEAEISDFEWQTVEDIGYYLFRNITFREMEPQNETDKLRWKANRESAYNGSFRHFLLSLYNNDLGRNRFRVVARDSDARARIHELERSMEVLQILMAYRIPVAELDRSVKVYYMNEPVDILIGPRGIRQQRASLTPLTSNRTFIVNSDGTLVDGRSVSLGGSWANTRISNMLPGWYTP